MAKLLRGKLVTCVGGGLQSYNDDKLPQKKYFALYYSAHWCPPCRQFTPQLVAFYRQMAAAHPELEVVLISSDHSAQEMRDYMDGEGMPWAALIYGMKRQERELMGYAGGGIPDLVLVDGSGNVVSDSYVHGRYVGPNKVLDDLRDRLKQ